jgi:arylsulfatase
MDRSAAAASSFKVSFMDMNRRQFVATLGASLAASSLGAEAGTRSGLPTAKRPNVVLMICDDLGSHDLGCYGSSIPTPNLDRLASQGVLLTNFNAGHPICSASRAALMTGRYAPRSGTSGAYFPNELGGMALDEITMANLFHDKGYRTMCIGKWHLGHTDAYLPTRRGFDHFYGVPYSDDMYPLPLIQDTAVIEIDTDRQLLTPRYAEEAVNFIGSATQPFFLYLAFSYPHNPALASPPFQGKSGHGVYGDCVHEIDAAVGSVIKALEEAGLADNTIVAFTSDHGPWFQGNPGMLRGRKGSTFEGGFRVPLILRAPGRVPAGATVNGRMSNFDMLPTLVGWCALDSPKLPLDGVDMHVLLQGETEEIPRKIILYFSPFGNRNDLHCARWGGWKLRVAQVDGEMYVADRTSGRESYKLTHPELYNLTDDPAECYDVADEHPDIVQRITDEMETELRTFPVEVMQQYTRVQTKKTYTKAPVAAAPPVPCSTC